MYFRDIILVALGVSNVLAITSPSLNNGDALIEVRGGSNCGDEPFVGCHCNDLADCNGSPDLFCATAEKKCRERAGPGAQCVAGQLSCFEGECEHGRCAGSNDGVKCTRDVDCSDGLVCRPDATDFGKGYEFQCKPPAKAKEFGARCRSDSECTPSWYCALKRGTEKYCGVNQQCVGLGASCSTDKDCCRLKCTEGSVGQIRVSYTCQFGGF